MMRFVSRVFLARLVEVPSQLEGRVVELEATGNATREESEARAGQLVEVEKELAEERARSAKLAQVSPRRRPSHLPEPRTLRQTPL